MRYKYLIIALFSSLFSQGKISLENVLDEHLELNQLEDMIGRIILMHIILLKEVMKG